MQSGLSKHIGYSLSNIVSRQLRSRHELWRRSPLEKLKTCHAPLRTVRHYAKPHQDLHAHNPPEIVQRRSVQVQHYERRAGAEVLLHGVQRYNVEQWLLILELHLPPRLRKDASLEEPADDFVAEKGASLRLKEINEVLHYGAQFTGHNLLIYLGVHEGRWEAMMWLTLEIIHKCPRYDEHLRLSRMLPSVLTGGDPDIMLTYVGTRRTQSTIEPQDFSLEEFLDSEAHQNGFSHRSPGHAVLGKIWMTLGNLVLEASVRPRTDPTHSLVMSAVLCILGQVHHLDLLPSSMYNYEIGGQDDTNPRPPTLYLLSQRIMTVLSDAGWKQHWEGEMTQALEYGYVLPRPRIQPQIPLIGTEIWMDLILWACVEGGWVDEGCALIQRMESQKYDTTKQWSTISWEEICKYRQPELGMTALLKLQLDRSRLNQSTGIGIANSGTSNIEPGKYTISREVLLALMDGLANRLYDRDSTSLVERNSLLSALGSCKRILDRTPKARQRESLMALILRGKDEHTTDVKVRRNTGPEATTVLDILQKSFGVREIRLADDSGDDHSASLLSLLYEELNKFAHESNTIVSLKIFKLIQDLIDFNRDARLDSFREAVEGQHGRAKDDVEIASQQESEPTPAIFPELPVHVVEALLNLIIETENFDLGNWLIFNDDIDGGAMSPFHFNDPCLQPQLLDYAHLVQDEKLQNALVERMTQSASSETSMRALLHHQFRRGNWRSAESMLHHMTKEAGQPWVIADIMELAAATLKWSSDRQDTSLALVIIQDLVHGTYDDPRVQAMDPDSASMRTQRLNQIVRILRSLEKSPFQRIAIRIVYMGKAARPASIISKDFKIILDAVTRTQGIDQAIALWERWVSPSTASSLPPMTLKDRAARFTGKAYVDHETVSSGDTKVIATLSLLRSILTPLQKRYPHLFATPFQRSQVSNQRLQGAGKHVNWVCTQYELLGYDARDLSKEIEAMSVEAA